MNIQELKAELEKRERQLKNADPEQKDFLQKKIDKLKQEIKEFKEPEKEPEKKNFNDFYDKLANILEVREGVTRSDAQGMIDTKEDDIKQRFYHEQGFTPLKAYQSYWEKKEPKKAKKEKPQPATKKVRAPRTKKQEGKRPSKEDCDKMLAEAKARVAKKKKLREKWAAKGKPVGGTPVDTIKKSADVVKNKVEKIKDSGKTLTKTQAEAITTGIEDIVKAVKKAISDRKGRELFIRRLIKALQKLI